MPPPSTPRLSPRWVNKMQPAAPKGLFEMESQRNMTAPFYCNAALRHSLSLRCCLPSLPASAFTPKLLAVSPSPASQLSVYIGIYKRRASLSYLYLSLSLYIYTVCIYICVLLDVRPRNGCPRCICVWEEVSARESVGMLTQCWCHHFSFVSQRLLV